MCIVCVPWRRLQVIRTHMHIAGGDVDVQVDAAWHAQLLEQYPLRLRHEYATAEGPTPMHVHSHMRMPMYA